MTRPTRKPAVPAAPPPSAITAARTRALFTSPYLGEALARMRLVPVDGLGTMAVDDHGRIYFDPVVAEKWGVEAAAGVLQHEVWHVLRAHSARATAAGAEPRMWNIAADAEINDDLVAARIPLPEGVVLPRAFGAPDGETAEQYYARLLAQQQQQQQQGQGQQGQGQGQQGQGQQGQGPQGQGQPGQGQGQPSDDPAKASSPGREGSGVTGRRETWELPADADGGMSESEQRVLARQVAEAIRSSANRGSVPGGMRRWADEVLAPPKVPWQRVLASCVRGQLAKAGVQDYSYARPSRRARTDIVLPAMRARKPAVAVVVDTSGSMGPDRLNAALAEVQGVCKALGAAVTVFACDAAVHGGRQRAQRASQVVLGGGGGTDMGAGIAEAVRARADLVVVLTDGYTPWPAEAPRARVVVGLIGEAEAAPTWATTVRIEVGP